MKDYKTYTQWFDHWDFLLSIFDEAVDFYSSGLTCETEFWFQERE